MEIDRHSLEPGSNLDDSTISIDEHDFVPHFQRVSISGEDSERLVRKDSFEKEHRYNFYCFRFSAPSRILNVHPNF